MSELTSSPPAGILTRRNVLLVLGISLGLFHLYTAIFGLLPATTQRGIHWGILGIMVFFAYPTGKWQGKWRWCKFALDMALVLLFAGSTYYLLSTWEANAFRIGPPPRIEVFFGCVMILLTLEAVRRTSGIVLPLIAVFFLVYAMFGPYFPGILRHKGYSLSRLAYYLYAGPSGIYGIPIGVSSSFIILFVLFGAFLAISKGGDFFMEISLALTRPFNAGIAKSAVIGSAFLGTMSGSPVANAVTSGPITIPLMKKAGYSPEVACAIEAVSSTGGMIIPPIMGAAAFIMAEYLQVPFSQVAIAAIIPSILYFVSVYFMIDLYSRRHNIAQKSTGGFDYAAVWNALRSKGHLGIPLIILITLLLSGWSPIRAVTWSIFIMVAVSWLKPETRVTPKKFFLALYDGSENMIAVASACASAGIILGVISITGIGSSISSILLSTFGGSLAQVLVISMLISLIVGMGLPATALYLILATLVTPALEKLGVEPMAAHMFVFYYGIISTITPPVALTAYATAGIGRANPNKTGFYAFYFGISSFIIPFMMVYAPEILLKGTPMGIAYRFLITVFAVYTLSCALMGFFKRPLDLGRRLLLGATAVILIIPDPLTDMIGIVGACVLFLSIHFAVKRDALAAGRIAALPVEEKVE